ncbi:MAG: dephospho-CoA kinase [Parasphingorhabdus sp.]
MANNPLKIGLTGGIGSGKTTVSDLFAVLDVPVFDSDVIAHEITHNNHPILERVRAQFGCQSIDINGNMDRTYMRKVIFNDAQKKSQLEAILHPAIRHITDQLVNNCQADYCILSIPLLIETNQLDRVDRLLVVDAEDSQRIKWIKMRSQLSEDEIVSIMATQTTRENRLSVADDVIVNDSDLSALEDKVSQLHQKYSVVAAQR